MKGNLTRLERDTLAFVGTRYTRKGLFMWSEIHSQSLFGARYTRKGRCAAFAYSVEFHAWVAAPVLRIHLECVSAFLCLGGAIVAAWLACACCVVFGDLQRGVSRVGRFVQARPFANLLRHCANF